MITNDKGINIPKPSMMIQFHDRYWYGGAQSHGEYSQIIQVTNDHDLVLQPLILWVAVILGNLQIYISSIVDGLSSIVFHEITIDSSSLNVTKQQVTGMTLQRIELTNANYNYIVHHL